MVSLSTGGVIDDALAYSNGRTYFFKGDEYWRINDACRCVDNGYPKKISENWKLVPDNIDAVVRWTKNGRTYFFKENLYYKFNDFLGTVDSGYPRPIASGWKDLPSNLDTAFALNGKTYFFKGSMYYRWNDAEDRVDSGYPKPISPRAWHGIPPGVNASLHWPKDRYLYFFTENVYYMFLGRCEGYPRSTCEDWSGLPCF